MGCRSMYARLSISHEFSLGLVFLSINLFSKEEGANGLKFWSYHISSK